MYRGLWQGTPVAIKKWFDPQATDAMMQEFRCAAGARPNVTPLHLGVDPAASVGGFTLQSPFGETLTLQRPFGGPLTLQSPFWGV